jgi:hypothetical protein
MPDDPDISFDEVKTILDGTIATYRSFAGLERDARNSRMAEYLAQHPAFEESGTENGVAWGRVRNGGLVIFDATGNDKGPSVPATVPPSTPAPDDTEDIAEKIRAKMTEITALTGTLMAGMGTLPDNEWQEKYAGAVASLRSLAGEIPGMDQEKEERDKKLTALLETTATGPEGRQQQASAFFAAFSGTMQSLAGSMAPPTTTPQGTQQGTPSRPATKFYGLPYSKVARLYTPFASVGWFGNAYNYLKKYDYDVEIVENAGVSEFMKVPECGVFAVAGHSSNFSVRMKHDPNNPKKPGELVQVFSVYTASPVNYATWKEYLALWHKGYLAIYHPEWEDLWCNWAVTDLFVLEYWKFAHNGFVYLDTCHPLREVSEQFRAALHAKGASVVAGWTWRGIDNIAGETSAYLFDRLLGANEFEGQFPVPVSKERDATGMKQRPFDWPAVRKDMTKKGLGRAYDEKYGVQTELEFDVLGEGDFGLLRPSIKYVETDEEKSTLTLHGLFGKRQNRGENVKVNGIELTIKEWSGDGDKIVCEGLKKEGKGSEGPVVVEINGIKSNSVPLTGWHADFTYTIEKEGGKKGETVATVTFPAFLRGDAHRIRDKPGEKPHFRPAGILMVRDPDQKLDFSLCGSCTHGKKTYRWDGSGTLIPMDDPRGAFAIWISYHALPGATVQFYVDVVTPPLEGKYSMEEDGKKIVTNAPWSIIVGYDFTKATEMEILKSTVDWDPKFDIEGNSLTWQMDFTNDSNPKIFKATLTWKDIEAKSPPDDDTEA